MAITFAAGQILTAAQMTSLAPISARKLAIETVNNTAALHNDTELVVSVLASTTYEMHLMLFYNSGVTPDLKIFWTAPAAATLMWGGICADAAGAVSLPGNLSLATTQVVGGSAADASAHFWGIFTTSATAGSLQLQWAQNTATVANTSLYAGSALLLRQIL